MKLNELLTRDGFYVENGIRKGNALNDMAGYCTHWDILNGMEKCF